MAVPIIWNGTDANNLAFNNNIFKSIIYLAKK